MLDKQDGTVAKLQTAVINCYYLHGVACGQISNLVVFLCANIAKCTEMCRLYFIKLLIALKW